MVAPTPQLESHELINRLVDAMRSGEISEFELRQIQRRAKHLLSQRLAPPEDCYMALAMTAFLDGNRPECEAALHNAIALAPKDQTNIRNAVGCLGGFGSVKEAFDLIYSKCSLFPDDKNFLRCAIMQAQQSLQFEHVPGLVQKYQKLSVNDPYDNAAQLAKSTLAMKKAAEECGLNDAEMLSRLQTAIDVVRKKGVEIRQTATQVLHDGTFIYNLYVNKDRSECAAINFDIADALVDKYEDTGIDIFSIICLPRTDYFQSTRIAGAM